MENSRRRRGCAAARIADLLAAAFARADRCADRRRGRRKAVIGPLALATALIITLTPGAAAQEIGAPSGCTSHSQVFFYNPNGHHNLLEQLKLHHSPCVDYYFHVPACPSDQTFPLRRSPDLAPDRLPPTLHLHALAEFNWNHWSQPESSKLSWRDKGAEFRRRMRAAGYTEPGDAWVVNELPTTAYKNDVQAQIVAAVQGLGSGQFAGAVPPPMTSPPACGQIADGAPGSALKGVVLDIGFGPAGKPNKKQWLLEGAGEPRFWQALDQHTFAFGQEAYVRCRTVCLPRTSPDVKAPYVNRFTEAFSRLAHATDAPAGVAPARQYFDGAYFPLMTAVWPDARNYGGNRPAIGVTRVVMERLISLETMATLRWARAHRYPDRRIGFAWKDGASGDGDKVALARRMTEAIAAAYGGAGPEAACRVGGDAGNQRGCDPEIPSATPDHRWDSWATWR